MATQSAATGDGTTRPSPPSDAAAVDHLLNGTSQPADPSTASTSAANEVLEKLASLDVARKAERERRREESRAAADPRESIAQFLLGFGTRQRRIESALQTMLTQQGGQSQDGRAPAPTAAQPTSTSSNNGNDAPLTVSAATPEQVQASLEVISAEVLALEQSAAAASYYLPLYDQRQCAAAVAALRAGIEGARAALAPRRRFAFGSKKVNKVRGEEVSAAAQAGPGPASAGADASTLATAAPAQTSAAPPPSSSPPEPVSSASASGAASASAAGADDDADAPAALVVSEQDRALVARGRGLMGLTDTEVILRVEEVEDGAVGGDASAASTSGAAAIGGSGGGDFVLLGLTRCRVVLLGRLRALRLAGLRGCSVVAGPVTGAVFADDVRGCSLSLAAYQVRVHRTHGTDLFLRVRSKPIIEHSAGVRVAPWAAGVAREPRLESLLQAHKLGECDDTGCWQQVDDFGWIKAVQSPNWCVMPEEARPAQPPAVPEGVWERRQLAAGKPEAGECVADVDEI